MYYLECDKCGFHNEVNSEYLTFCKNCKEKIKLNFTNWKKLHPECSFDDFKNTICLSEEEKKAVPKTQPKKQRKNLKYWVSFGIIFLVFFLVGSFGGKYIGNFFSNLINSNQISVSVFEKKWEKQTFPLNVTIETPVFLEEKSLAVNDNIKHYIDKIDYYVAEQDLFSIAVNVIKYKSIIGEASLEGGAQGAVAQMKSQKGVSEFQYNQEVFNNNKLAGILQKGRFTQDKIAKIAFTNAIFAKELLAWQIIIIYPEGDEVGKKIAERVIKSIKISN